VTGEPESDMGAHWYDFTETGFGPIDADHREITRRLDAFLAAVNSGDLPAAGELATAFVEGTAHHFAREERLMRTHAYPQYPRHKESHDLFLADARGLLGGVQASGVTAEFRRWATGPMLAWFRFHIVANDVGLGRFLRDRAPDAPDEPEPPAGPAAPVSG